jgi:hypothetical protein
MWPTESDCYPSITADSVVTVARSMVDDMMSFYTGHLPGGVPGLLPKPYYCE